MELKSLIGRAQNSLKVTVIALVVMGVIGVPALPTTSRADDVVVELQVKDGHFQPSNLIVKANTPFKIRITNADKSSIEFESFSLNREREVAPGQTVTVYFPALAPGTYEFFDDFHKSNKGTITAR
ncbi:MAG: cupredoxin domain-containing protein [Ignavibacteriales bacterium]